MKAGVSSSVEANHGPFMTYIMTSWAMYSECGADVKPDRSADDYLLLLLYKKMKDTSIGTQRNNFMMRPLVRSCRLSDSSTNSSQRQLRL